MDTQTSAGYSTGLGIASISGYLKQHGIQTDLIYYKNQNDLEYAIQKTRTIDPDIIGFYSTSIGWPVIQAVSEKMRIICPDAKQVYGGIHATLNPEIIFHTSALDALCVGYGEEPMLEICRKTASHLPWTGIPGIWLRSSPEAQRLGSPPPSFPESHPDNFLYFDHTLFLEELSKYKDFNRDSYQLEIIFNRGCPFHCTFCCNHQLNKIYKNKTFLPSPEASIAALKRAIAETGLNRVEIHDDILTLNKKWFRPFISLYRAQINLPFICNLRVNTFDEEDLRLLKDANLATAWIGIESGNDYIRNTIMKKGISQNAIYRSFELLHKYEIPVVTQNIIGVPHETPDMFLDTVRLNAEIKPAASFLSVFYPYPSTELYHMCVAENLIGTSNENFIERQAAILNSPDFAPEEIQIYFNNFNALIKYQQHLNTNTDKTGLPLTAQNVPRILNLPENEPQKSQEKQSGARHTIRAEHSSDRQSIEIPTHTFQPVSRVFGLDRGEPIDRHFIEKFLKQNSERITGRVLEVENNIYTTKFGQAVTHSDILHAVPSNVATIVGDLATGKNIPENAFDCIILTQTIHVIYDVKSTLKNAVNALKPGGVLLITVPGISMISRYDMDRWGDFWRFTDKSLKMLLAEYIPPENVTVESFGNIEVAKAFLDGLALHEIPETATQYNDEDFQVVLTARAIKPEAKKSVSPPPLYSEQKKMFQPPLVLIYHRVWHDPIDPQALCVSPDNFEEHLKELTANYRVLPLFQLIDEIKQEQLIPDTVSLTFDDGYFDNLTHVLPLLEKYNAHATIFVTSGMMGSMGEFWWDKLERIFIEEKQIPSELTIDESNGFRGRKLITAEDRLQTYLDISAYLYNQPFDVIERFMENLSTWAGIGPQERATHLPLKQSQLSKLASSPHIEIGAHTLNHSRLSLLPPELQQQQVFQSKVCLETLLRKPVRFFSYPFGMNNDFTTETAKIVAMSGFEAGISNIQSHISLPLNLYAIPRRLVRNWPADVFSQWLQAANKDELERESLDNMPEHILNTLRNTLRPESAAGKTYHTKAGNSLDLFEIKTFPCPRCKKETFIYSDEKWFCPECEMMERQTGSAMHIDDASPVPQNGPFSAFCPHCSQALSVSQEGKWKCPVCNAAFLY